MAENFEMEGLEFEILGDTKQADSNLTQLIAKLEKLKNTLKGSGLNTTNNQLAKLNNNLYQIKNSVAALNKTNGLTDALEKLASIKIPPTIAKRIGEITAAANTLSTDSVVHIQMLSEALKNLDGVKIGKITMPKIEAAQTAKETAAKATENSAISQNMQEVEAHTEEATESIEKFNGAVSEADGATDGAKTRFARFSEIAVSIKDRFLSVTSGLKSLVSGLGKVGKTVASVTKKFLSFTKTMVTGQFIGSKLGASTATFTSKLGKFFSSLKRIAFYRIIRTIISSITSGIKEGMTNLYYYSQQMGTQFAPNMDKLATSALYLKNSLGALTDPIVDRLAPAVDLLVDKFVDLLNIVNQVIATLNGQTEYTAAKKYATSWQEAADSTKKSLDEVKRYVLGFDELNILGSNKNKSSGTADTGLDYSQMFEQRAISSSVKSFTDTIKKAFKQKEFEKLGRNIGEWINKGIKKIPDIKLGVAIGTTINEINDFLYGLLDSIDTQKLGSKISSNINAAVNTIKWGNLGKTLGTYGNKILQFWNGLLDIDAVKLGAGLGKLVAKAVETYDWKLLGSNLGGTLTKIAEFFNNFIKSSKLGKVGEALGDFLTRALKTTNWTEIGSTVASLVTAIPDFFIGLISHTDFKEVGNAIGETIKSFLTDVNTWIESKDWEEIGENVFNDAVDLIKGLDVIGIVKGLAKLVWNIIKAAIQFAFGVGMGAGKLLAETIGDAIGDSFVELGEDIGNWIKEGVDSIPILGDITSLFEKENAIEFGEAMADPLKLALEPLREYLEQQKKAAAADEKLQRDNEETRQTAYADRLRMSQQLMYGATQGLTYDQIALIKNLTKSSTSATNIPDIKPETIASLLGGATDITSWLLTGGADHNSTSGLLDNIKTNVSSALTGLTGSVSKVELTNDAKVNFMQTVLDVPTRNNVQTLKPTTAAKNALIGAVAGLSLKANSINELNPTRLAWNNFYNGVNQYGLNANNIKSLSPTSAAWGDYYNSVKGYGLTGTITDIEIKKAITQTMLSGVKIGLGVSGFVMAGGGKVSNGYITSWNDIPKYAGGTSKAHGSVFVAGENGAEIVGNINGNTEILNKSQMAQAMYSATVAGMQAFTAKVVNKLAESANAIINSVNRVDEQIALRNDTVALNSEDRYTNQDNAVLMAEAMSASLNSNTERQNDLLREQNELLRGILEKDMTAEITTRSVVNALGQKNRRDGRYTVPVGIT